ncbi:MAG: hypothetical protein K0Q90_1742 [Paenibacillaceae bacterium]|nr:hypothetical protein [Paenibacillaceae bacterium]
MLGSRACPSHDRLYLKKKKLPGNKLQAASILWAISVSFLLPLQAEPAQGHPCNQQAQPCQLPEQPSFLPCFGECAYRWSRCGIPVEASQRHFLYVDFDNQLFLMTILIHNYDCERILAGIPRVRCVYPIAGIIEAQCPVPWGLGYIYASSLRHRHRSTLGGILVGNFRQWRRGR